jgi:hypothetical protein
MSLDTLAGEKRNAQKYLIGNQEGNKRLGKSIRRYSDINAYFKDI